MTFKDEAAGVYLDTRGGIALAPAIADPKCKPFGIVVLHPSQDGWQYLYAWDTEDARDAFLALVLRHL